MAIAQPVRSKGTNVQNMNPGDMVRLEAHIGPVVDGTEIISMRFERPTPNLRFDYEADLIIAIRHAPGPSGQDRADAVGFLRALIAEARLVIDRTAALVR